jgi:hypothetical protein
VQVVPASYRHVRSLILAAIVSMVVGAIAVYLTPVRPRVLAPHGALRGAAQEAKRERALATLEADSKASSVGAPARQHAQYAAADEPSPTRGVVKTARGLGLAGANVCWGEARAASRAELICTLTDAAGNFVLPGSATYPGALFASASGYLPQLRRWEQPPAQAAEIVLVLAPGGVEVSGWVLDALGGTVPGARITARGADAEAVLAVTESDATGQFRLTVAEGVVHVSADADAYSDAVERVVAPCAGVTLALAPQSRIGGRVVAESSGAPIAGAVVTASGDQGLHATARSVETDAEGAFQIERLAAGSYQLVAAAPEWRSETRAVHVGLGQTTDGVTLTASSATTLSGAVEVAGAPCRDGYYELSGPVWSARSIDDGRVEVDGLLPGQYQISLSCARALTRAETLSIGNQPVEHLWSLDLGLELKGTVQTASGQPAAAARVDVFPIGEPRGRPNVSCATDDSGQFSCAGLLPGDYECVVGENAPQRVSLNAATAANVLLRMQPTGTIRVWTTKHGRAAPGSLLVLARRPGQTPLWGTQRGEAFVFERLTLGRYEVYVEQAPGATARVHLQQDGETVELRLPLPREASVSGRVLDEQGVPVPNAWVRASLADSEYAAFTPVAAPVLTDDDGAFSIHGLFARKYDLKVSADSAEGRAENVAGGSERVLIAVRGSSARVLPIE